MVDTRSRCGTGDVCASHPRLTGFDVFALAAPSRAVLAQVAERCDRLGVSHSGVREVAGYGASPPPQLSPTTPARPRSRSPARRSPGIVSPATGIGNSTPPSTPSPSPKSAYPSSRGHRYYKSKIAEGKTPREAARCLKRRLADHLWRTMINDERRAAGPGGQLGTTLQSSVAGPTPTTNSSDKSLPGPANHDSTTAKPSA